MKAAKEVGCRGKPIRWSRSCWLQRAAIVLLGGYNAAHFGAMWRRMGRQGTAAGEGRPGGTAAGEGKRGRRIGAGVLALTNLGFVLTSGAQVAPTVEPWPAGIAALAGLVSNGRRRSNVGPGPAKPVQALTAPWGERGAP